MLDWKEQVAAFADVMAYSEGSARRTLDNGGEPVIVRPAFGTGSFFSVAGCARRVRPAHVRGRRDVADRAVRSPVLSHHLWRDRFGSDRKIIGRTIQLDGAPVSGREA